MQFAYSLNQSNDVVGVGLFNIGGTPSNFPALWTPSGGLIDINTLLPANSGWILTGVSQIDDAGDMVGNGTYNGTPNVQFLMLAPEPDGFAVILPAALLTRRRSRR